MVAPINVFARTEFWLLVVFSLVIPVGIYTTLLARRVVSKFTVLIFGLTLVLLAGVDVYLLQVLASVSQHTSSLADDAVFTSELTVALYLLPVLFGGVGVNMVSHVLIRHLNDAENRFDQEKHRI